MIRMRSRRIVMRADHTALPIRPMTCIRGSVERSGRDLELTIVDPGAADAIQGNAGAHRRRQRGVARQVPEQCIPIPDAEAVEQAIPDVVL